jgi:hypothetical protein
LNDLVFFVFFFLSVCQKLHIYIYIYIYIYRERERKSTYIGREIEREGEMGEGRWGGWVGYPLPA